MNRNRLTLYLDVREHPGVLAGEQPHAYQLVDDLQPQISIAHDLLQLLIQEGIGARPVDFSVSLGEKEGEEVFQVLLQCLLPRAIEVD